MKLFHRHGSLSDRFVFNRFFLYYIVFFYFMVLAGCGGTKKINTNDWQTIVIKTTDSQNRIQTNISPEQRAIIKYASYLKTDPDSIKNSKLYIFIDKWLNTPYQWGGSDEKGIDCSAFIQRLLNEVYNIQIPRTSVEQFFTKNIEPFHDNHYFSEGDLVFFSTIPGKPISHVGLYLHNRVFVNASFTHGVSLANLDDPYWKRRFIAAGRIRANLSTAVNTSF